MRLSLVVLLLVGCSKKPAAVAPSAAPDAPMKFDWPAGAVGVRSADSFSGLTLGELTETTHTRTQETWTVSRADSGWDIQVTDAVFQEFQGAQPPPAAQALAQVPQTMVVDADGGYGGLKDPQGWSDRAKKALSQHFDPANAMGQIQVDMMVQPDAVDGSLDRMWTSLVGHWIGRLPVQGDLGSVDGVDPLGTIDPRGSKLRVRGRIPCGEGTCVELVATADSVPPMLAGQADGILSAWVESLESAPEETGIDDRAMGMEVVVVVEPATLLPWSYSARSWVSGVARADEQRLPYRDERGKTVTWAWTRAGGDG